MKTLAYLVVAIAGVAVAQCLCGCKALEDMPVTIGVEGNYGTYGYSSESGLSIKARIREEKSGRITPQEIRNRWKK